MILTLSFVGVFSLRNSLTDCAIASAFGVFGMILKRLNLPVVPIILGMVLGNIMEVKLRAASANISTPLDMFDRPISALLIALILFVIVQHIRALRFEHVQQHLKETEDDGSATADEQPASRT
jgi:putative tricarboxylic transport membrane protein